MRVHDSSLAREEFQNVGQIRTLGVALQADFDVAKREGVGIDAVARAIGRKPGVVYKYLEDLASFPADRLPQWAAATGGDAAICWAPRTAGMVVVPQPRQAGRETASLLREFVELVESIDRAEDDHRIRRPEAEDIEAEGLDVVAAVYALIEAYRARVVNGNRASSLAEAHRAQGRRAV